MVVLDDYYDFINDFECKDYFVVFLNIIVEEFDLYINYFVLLDCDCFDLWMSGKLEGIGVRF